MNNDEYLAPTPIIESQHPDVVAFVDKHAHKQVNHLDCAVKLYNAVRDEIRYDFYRMDISVEGLKASTILKNEYGWCVSKAALLAACCRSKGIPARLGYADVRNHLSTPRLREQMKTDIFYWHGYTSIYIDGNWVKATPAFNIELCTKFNIHPLDFDGRTDSIFHEFDEGGNKHMEYLQFRGEFADVPVNEILKTFKHEYP